MPNIKIYKAKKMELEPIENPIIIHPHLLQRFLKHGKDYANLLALYSFYIYHAQRQKTNQPLVTDEFTRKGMNWAMDRVKKTKRILKEMKLIEVIQKRKYYYVHLFFIYTKKTIGKILGKSTQSLNTSESEDLSPKKPKKSKEKLKPSALSEPMVLKQWLDYCKKKKIKYGKSNIKYWEKKIDKRLTIEQQQAIYTAIEKGWKDFFFTTSIKESKYHKLLGKSLMMEKDCDTLLDISYINKKFVYQFKNIKVTTATSPLEIFDKYGYVKSEVKTAPIVSVVQDKIMGVIRRF